MESGWKWADGCRCSCSGVGLQQIFDVCGNNSTEFKLRMCIPIWENREININNIWSLIGLFDLWRFGQRTNSETQNKDLYAKQHVMGEVYCTQHSVGWKSFRDISFLLWIDCNLYIGMERISSISRYHAKWEISLKTIIYILKIFYFELLQQYR